MSMNGLASRSSCVYPRMRANAGLAKYAATSGRGVEVVVVPATLPSTETVTRVGVVPSSQSAAQPMALTLSATCFALALFFGWEADGEPVRVVYVVVAYMTLNLAYSLKLKHVVLVDAFCIAAGFLLRVIAGGLAVPAVISHWLLLCTMFLALFLALCKRRAEMDLLGEGRGRHRVILLEYNTGFLDQMVTVLAACAIVTYTMYTVSDDTAKKFGQDHLMIWTVPFVVFGLARYLLLVQTQKGGGSPTKVLLGGDPLFAANTLGWIAMIAWIASRPH